MGLGQKLGFFCFRSCLKGERSNEFYEILEIPDPESATLDVIKRQYKTLSLAYHPV
jgi:hypothetical protein